MADVTLINLQQTINTGGKNGKPLDHRRFDRTHTPTFDAAMKDVEAHMQMNLAPTVIAWNGEHHVQAPLQITDESTGDNEVLTFTMAKSEEAFASLDENVVRIPYEVSLVDRNNDKKINIPADPAQLGAPGMDAIVIRDYTELNKMEEVIVTPQNYAKYQPVLADLNNRLSQATNFRIGSF
jgi:hypothetical protein